MRSKVKNFISLNKITTGNRKWEIDGVLFCSSNDIPLCLLEKEVTSWILNRRDDVIELTTR